MNKIQYWLTRNYYVWLVCVLLSSPVNTVFVYIKGFVGVTSEIFTEITKAMRSFWEDEKDRIERQMKKGKR